MKTVKFLGVSRVTRAQRGQGFAQASFQVGLLWRTISSNGLRLRTGSVSFVSFHFETNRPITFLFFRPPSFLSSPFHDTLFDNIPGRTRNDSYRASIRYFLRSIAGRLVDRLIYNLIVFVEDTFRFVRENFRKLPPLNKGALLGKNWKKKKKERKNYWIENFIRARRMKSIRGCTDGDKLKPKNRSKLLSIQANDNG